MKLSDGEGKVRGGSEEGRCEGDNGDSALLFSISRFPPRRHASIRLLLVSDGTFRIYFSEDTNAIYHVMNGLYPIAFISDKVTVILQLFSRLTRSVEESVN